MYSGSLIEVSASPSVSLTSVAEFSRRLYNGGGPLLRDDLDRVFIADRFVSCRAEICSCLKDKNTKVKTELTAYQKDKLVR